MFHTKMNFARILLVVILLCTGVLFTQAGKVAFSSDLSDIRLQLGVASSTAPSQGRIICHWIKDPNLEVECRAYADYLPAERFTGIDSIGYVSIPLTASVAEFAIAS